jgi:hypothetical protein
MSRQEFINFASSKKYKKSPSPIFKICPEKVIEGYHVLLFAEFNVICNVLHYLGHQH